MNLPPVRPLIDRKPESAFEALSYAQWIAFAPTIFQCARSLRDTGVLEAVDKAGKPGLSAAEIRERSGLSEYGARVLVEGGLGIGLLSEVEGRYQLTTTGRMLLRDPMTRANMDFSHNVTYHGMFELETAVRENRPAGLAHFGTWPTIYEGLAHLPERVRKSWFSFDHYYSDAAFGPALKLVFDQPPRCLLDIGGNTGKWALRCLSHDSNVQVGLFDLPGQLNLARKTLADAGLDARAVFHEGNLLDEAAPLPAGYDAIWMSQFLDCFSEAQIVSILRRCRAALAPGGRIFILETLWDRQRFPIASFSLQMTSLYFTALANGNSQMYRSTTFLACVQAAGLTVEREQDGVGHYHTLLTCRAA